uniref:VWFA domain-containing protein n=1 Tax=Catharus ustulatus TaxID=91951 RepID=A0A8C3V232_CATUS
ERLTHCQMSYALQKTEQMIALILRNTLFICHRRDRFSEQTALKAAVLGFSVDEGWVRVDRVTVGRNATRVGLVLYSLEVRLEFGLNKYPTQQDVKRAIRRMQYMGEGTYTGTAIRKATQEGFSAARAGVRKVAIVLTDGQTDKREAVKLELVVREAHAANIEMYAIGIVNTSDPTQAEFVRELNLIASDPDREHMYLIDDFNTLSGVFMEVFFCLVASHKGPGSGRSIIFVDVF